MPIASAPKWFGPEEWRINFVAAISTTILAFIALIGLILALVEFIEVRGEVLGIGWSVLIGISVVVGLIIVAWRTARWIKNG